MGDDAFHPLLSPGNAKRIIKQALKEGIYTFDTAFSYRNADTLLSSALKEAHVERNRIEIISKVMPVPSLERKTETILRRINSDYLDALLLHWPSDEESVYQSLRKLEKLREEGKVMQIGVSNFPPSFLEKVISDFGISIHERPLSLIWPKWYDDERKLNIKLYCYAPLAMGILAKDGSFMPVDARKDLYIYKEGIDEYNKLRDVIDDIQKETSLTYAEIAYSWIVSKSPDAIIFGASSTKQIPVMENKLSLDQIDSLDIAAANLCQMAQKDNIFSHNYLLR